MSTQIQPKTIGDLLVLEVKPGWSKERGMLAAGSIHLFGTVLALVGGVYKSFDPDAVDGSEKAHAVLAEEVDATAAAAPGVVIARGAVLDAEALVWPVGITAPEKAAALVQLEARGIITRILL